MVHHLTQYDTNMIVVQVAIKMQEVFSSFKESQKKNLETMSK